MKSLFRYQPRQCWLFIICRPEELV